jgi:hypothetical protein
MDEIEVGRAVLAFDGRVLEVFGLHAEGSARYHARRLIARIERGCFSPYQLVLTPHEKAGGQVAVPLGEQHLPPVRDLLTRLAAAGAEVSAG